MKREQMEAIASAAAGLLSVVEGAKSLNVYSHDPAISGATTTVCVRCETDDDVAALAGIFSRALGRHEFGDEYYLSFHVELGAVRLAISGPYHDIAPRPQTDPTLVASAIAYANTARGGAS